MSQLIIFIKNNLSATEISLLWSIFISCLSGVIIYLLPSIKKGERLLIFTIFTAIFTYLQSFPGLLITNLSIFIFIKIIDHLVKPRKNRRAAQWQYCVSLLLIFTIIFLVSRILQFDKYKIGISGKDISICFLDMWVFLKLISYIWEYGSGRISQLDLKRFIIWSNLPFLAIGPILRYSQFDTQLKKITESNYYQEVFTLKWWQRLFINSCYLIVGVIFAKLAFIVLNKGFYYKLSGFLLLAPWSFYLLSAGFFGFMEALALMWNFQLPPSYNNPFGRANISDFWANWNMTATNLFRDLLFYNRWGLKKINPYFNTIILFFCVGAWHSANFYWISWGLMHGIGFIFYLWHKQLIQSKRFNSSIFQNNYFAPIITYLFICSCWAVPPQIMKLIKLMKIPVINSLLN